ncbi:conserved hypothetical protein [Hyella patelloides LEGE 07179]|uniref:ABM domain-containing protein n=1 Tax=Hyella patelloides LEGE 07179 TaxID=945734 RepID=A0A563W5J7_9CYAN|nr:TIGR03792 family protein [Hyella patelloides]VEP18972.1 conserved hypothetical protein [Hyella patelloides LEGE 07179]
MVIEWLGFRVEPKLREKFIEEDEKIWTPVLADADGFLGKEIWIAPGQSDRVFLIIRWQTREQWKAVPMELLVETEAKFMSAMGKGSYEMLESKEYQIRKFP